MCREREGTPCKTAAPLSLWRRRDASYPISLKAVGAAHSRSRDSVTDPQNQICRDQRAISLDE